MRNDFKNLKNNSLRICIIILSLTMVSTSFLAQVSRVKAQEEAKVFIDPDFQICHINQTITIGVNVSNVADLYNWQVALKYNGTVVNCTGVWLSDDNVFAGQSPIEVPPQLGNDTIDHLQYIIYGSSLITTSIPVTNGILFKANFTALIDGETTITVLTKENPAHTSSTSWDVFDTELYDFDMNPVKFTTGGGTVVTGNVNAKPISQFVVTSPTADNSTRLVLYGHQPPGGTLFAQSFKGYTMTLNASGSYDPDGNITLYMWSFGDGNYKNTTSPDLTYIYNNTGSFSLQLVVQDNANPPAYSDPVTRQMVVGIVLDYFDWSPLVYAVGVLAVVGVVIYAAQETRHYMQRRRDQKRQKLLMSRRMTGAMTSQKGK